MHKNLRSFLIVAGTTSLLAACHAHQNQPIAAAPVYITDQEVTSSVQHKIDQTRGIRGKAIMISSHNGVVTLNGSVKNQRSVDIAEAAAASVPGVTAVKSNLIISR